MLEPDFARPFAPLKDRVHRLRLGAFVIAQIEIGWSATVVGTLWGRIPVPGNPPGYMYLRVEILGKQVLYGCYQLA